MPKTLIRLLPVLTCLLAGQLAGQDLQDVIRDNANRRGQQMKIEFDAELTTTIDIPEKVLKSCQASIELGYLQNNTSARVDTLVRDDSCSQVDGQHELMISYRDSNDVLQRQSHLVEWSLDGEALEFRQDYLLGEDVTLSRVFSRKLRCECLDAPAVESLPSEQTTDSVP